MRRVATLCGAMGMTILLAGSVLAAPALAAPKNQDAATGNGTRADLGYGAPKFSFKAVSGPSGERPTGNLHLEYPDRYATFTATVSCLVVNGQEALLIGEMTGGTGFDVYPGSPVAFKVWDLGSPYKGHSPDLMSNFLWGSGDLGDATADSLCADPSVLDGRFPLQVGLASGDIVVHDALP
jgi:hypothetical protein